MGSESPTAAEVQRLANRMRDGDEPFSYTDRCYTHNVLHELIERLSELTKERDAANAESAQRISAAMAELEKVREQFAAWRETHYALQGELTAANAERQRWEDMHLAICKDRDLFASQVDQLMRQKEKSQVDYAIMESDRDQAQEQCASAERELNDLDLATRKEIEALKANAPRYVIETDGVITPLMPSVKLPQRWDHVMNSMVTEQEGEWMRTMEVLDMLEDADISVKP